MTPGLQKPQVSLTVKFALIFVLAAALSGIFIASFVLKTSYQTFQQEAFSRMEAIASLRLTQIHIFIERLQTDAASFLETDADFYADMLHFKSEPSAFVRDHIRKHLDQFVNFRPASSEMFLLDPDTGLILVSTDASHEGLSRKGFDYFEAGKKQPFYTPVYTSTLDSTPTLVISYPIRDIRNELLYIAGVRVNLVSFEDILSFRDGLGKTGVTYLVDREHRLIAGTDYQYFFKKKIYSAGIDQALGGHTGPLLYDDYDSTPVVGHVAWIPDLQLAFAAEQHTDEAFASFYSLRRIVILFVLLITFFVFVMALLMIRAVIRPVRQLTAFAQEVSHGKYKEKFLAFSNDEIGILAHSMNVMTDRLVGSLEESKTIINLMPDPLFTLDEAGKIKFLNRSALDLFHLDKSSKATGLVFSDHLLCSAQGSFVDRLRKEGQLSDIQCRFADARRHPVPVIVSGTVLRDAHGGVRGFLVVVKDLRELRKYAKARIDLLTPFLQRISLGDFSVNTPLLDKEDEFHDLFLAIGLMTDNLRQLIKENEEKTRQILETHRHLLEAKTNLETEKIRLNAVLENMGDGLVAIDKDGQLLLMNHMAETFFDRKRETLLGKNFLEETMIENKEGEPIASSHRPLIQAMDHRRHILKVVYIHRRPYRLLASPLILGRKLFGAVSILQDISREQAIDKAKSEFVSLASHQLRTPLTSIRWLLEEILRKKHGDKSREEYLSDALESTQRMIRLVNDLLNLSRMEAGAIDIDPKDTNLGDLVDQVVSDARASIDLHKQTVLIHKPRGGIPLHADPVLIRQVITNLLSNALRYSDPHKTITLTLEKKGSKAWFTIQDQGIGIPPELQSRMYEKFFRSEEAAKRSTNGSGLGMYLVKKIIDAIQGSISFVSSPGKGTTFHVGFPLKSAVTHKGPQKLIEYHIS